MAEKIRLDKLLSQLALGSRSDVKNLIKAGKVRIDNVIQKDPGKLLSGDEIIVKVAGVEYAYKPVRTVMLNKPQGVLTAARDKKQKTVMDLLPDMYTAMNCMPAGRLDKNTEGLLIITNDGQLAHHIISPKHDVGKEYLAVVDGELTEEHVKAFSEGLQIHDSDGDFEAKPAILMIENHSPQESTCRVVIREGKYHQVKRMFSHFGMTVTYLKRLSIGGLKLDPSLAPGDYREMSLDEVYQMEVEYVPTID